MPRMPYPSSSRSFSRSSSSSRTSFSRSSSRPLPRRGGIGRLQIRAIAQKSDQAVKRIVRQRQRPPQRSSSASRSHSRSHSIKRQKRVLPARKKKQLDLAALGRQRRRENVLLVGKQLGRKGPNLSARFAYQGQKAIGLDGNKWIKKGNRWVRM